MHPTQLGCHRAQTDRDYPILAFITTNDGRTRPVIGYDDRPPSRYAMSNVFPIFDYLINPVTFYRTPVWDFEYVTNHADPLPILGSIRGEYYYGFDELGRRLKGYSARTGPKNFPNTLQVDPLPTPQNLVKPLHFNIPSLYEATRIFNEPPTMSPPSHALR